MRRSQSTGDIDGRDSDDGAAEYIQYIDEGFIITIFIIFILRWSELWWHNTNQSKARKRKPLQQLLLLFSSHLHHLTLTAALRSSSSSSSSIVILIMIFYPFNLQQKYWRQWLVILLIIDNIILRSPPHYHDQFENSGEQSELWCEHFNRRGENPHHHLHWLFPLLLNLTILTILIWMMMEIGQGSTLTEQLSTITEPMSSDSQARKLW